MTEPTHGPSYLVVACLWCLARYSRLKLGPMIRSVRLKKKPRRKLCYMNPRSQYHLVPKPHEPPPSQLRNLGVPASRVWRCRNRQSIDHIAGTPTKLESLHQVLGCFVFRAGTTQEGQCRYIITLTSPYHLSADALAFRPTTFPSTWGCIGQWESH